MRSDLLEGSRIFEFTLPSVSETIAVEDAIAQFKSDVLAELNLTEPTRIKFEFYNAQYGDYAMIDSESWDIFTEEGKKYLRLSAGKLFFLLSFISSHLYCS